MLTFLFGYWIVLNFGLSHRTYFFFFETIVYRPKSKLKQMRYHQNTENPNNVLANFHQKGSMISILNWKIYIYIYIFMVSIYNITVLPLTLFSSVSPSPFMVSEPLFSGQW